MPNKIIITILSLLLISFNLLAEPISVSAIMATQESVGYDAVNRMITGWAKDYVAMPAGERASKSFLTYVAEITQKKAVPGIRGPNGVVFITDGHHRSTALARIIYGNKDQLPEFARDIIVSSREAIGGAKEAEKLLKVNVNISGEYRTINEVVKTLQEKGSGYFSAIDRGALNANLVKPADLYAKLPKLTDLPDNPLRSAVGVATYQLGLDSNNFKDYVEFFIAEKLPANLKAKINSSTVNDPTVLAEIKEFILSNNKVITKNGKVENILGWLKSDMIKSPEGLKNLEEMPKKFAAEHTLTKKAGEQSKDDVLSAVRKIVCP